MKSPDGAAPDDLFDDIDTGETNGDAKPQTMLDWALYYARRGVAVFPCDPTTKKPLTPCDLDANGKKIRGTGGVKKATRDEATIRELWRVHPSAMIGAATGAHSGFWAVDPDAPHEDMKTGAMTPDGRVVWAELQAKHGAHDPTIEVMTPGGGEHTYFKFDPMRPLGNAEGDLAGLGGINVRGSGGYAIVAPSVRADGKAYVAKRLFDPAALADAPEWLYGLIGARKRKDRDRKTSEHPSGGGLPTVYQGLFSVAREGLKVVPVFNMAQATLRRRSAIDRKARPWL